jgi:hypothetical protein
MHLTLVATDIRGGKYELHGGDENPGTCRGYLFGLSSPIPVGECLDIGDEGTMRQFVEGLMFVSQSLVGRRRR